VQPSASVALAEVDDSMALHLPEVLISAWNYLYLCFYFNIRQNHLDMMSQLL